MEKVVDVSELTIEQLEALTKQKKAEMQQKRDEERKQYEHERDSLVADLSQKAKRVHDFISAFKIDLHTQFAKHETLLNEYGGIRSNSKGGFSLTTSDGKLRVTRVRSTAPSWDERSSKALDLIGDFLKDTVKKKDLKLFEILYSFIQKNEKGDLEYSKVMHLLSHKDKYDDPRWVEGLNLINESYSVQLRAFGYEFFEKTEEGKWQKIEVNFTAI